MIMNARNGNMYANTDSVNGFGFVSEPGDGCPIFDDFDAGLFVMSCSGGELSY